MDRLHRPGVVALLLLALPSFLGCTSEDVPNAAARPLPSRTTAVLGTNLNAVNDWSSELVFADLFKMSRPFFSGTDSQWDDHRELDLDARGFVRSLKAGQIARTMLLTDAVGSPAGVYTVSHDGKGTVEYRYGSHTDRAAVSATPDRLKLTAASDTISISIVQTDPKDPLRNFQVSLPGLDATSEDGTQFNPDFLDSLSAYGVLRFMDWMQTNSSTQVSWDDRPTLEDATFSKNGVPVEVMVELVNQAGKDPWFCMPHLADDGYIEQFATYVRDHVGSARKIYVEYSNEVWNGAFTQADYARAQGVMLGLGSNDFEAQMHYYALRATEVHKIWERVFGGTDRLIRVTASQAANSWVSSAILGFRDTAVHTDVLAIAPYFGGRMGEPAMEARVQAMTVATLLNELRTVDLPAVNRAVLDHWRVAGEHGIELVAYEGGQHLAGLGDAADNDTLNELFDATNTDPNMKALYTDYLAGFRANGGRLFMHFTSCAAPSSSGRWGAVEWLGQPRADAPKYDALLGYVANNPRWW